MSDRELGELLGGYSQTMIATAKAGRMSDPLALRVAEVVGAHPGEVLLVARAERERDGAVKAALIDYASKTLAALPSNTARTERGGMAAGHRLAAALALSPADIGRTPVRPRSGVHYVK